MNEMSEKKKGRNVSSDNLKMHCHVINDVYGSDRERIGGGDGWNDMKPVHWTIGIWWIALYDCM